MAYLVYTWSYEVETVRINTLSDISNRRWSSELPGLVATVQNRSDYSFKGAAFRYQQGPHSGATGRSLTSSVGLKVLNTKDFQLVFNNWTPDFIFSTIVFIYESWTHELRKIKYPWIATV